MRFCFQMPELLVTCGTVTLLSGLNVVGGVMISLGVLGGIMGASITYSEKNKPSA
jgi:hypothetical protein